MEAIIAVRRNWSVEEVRHALALYLRTDFGRCHNRNPEIIQLANHLKRTPSAVAMKLCNLAALDTSLPQKGMANASKTDRLVWAEFLSEPHNVLDSYRHQISDIFLPQTPPAHNHLEGFSEKPAHFDYNKISLKQAGERIIETTQRIGQDFFRKIILTSYQSRCALTGIDDKRLLNASHIIAWKDDVQNRINPSNGICLNALHDRAFDRHMITFDEDYKMIVNQNISRHTQQKLEKTTTGGLELPARFLPDQKFLEKHREVFYRTS